ncbi:MAG: hypothetical protein K2P81_12195 [Bacteriovoracaceae bacterium]|nr:hypothetical protein [Bacteriovoracaceae bacterium]
MDIIGNTGATVIDLAAQREKRDKERTAAEYKGYLKSLESITQLESEAQYLLEEFSEQNYGNEYSLKVQLLVGELAARADENFQAAIQRLSSLTHPDPV